MHSNPKHYHRLSQGQLQELEQVSGINPYLNSSLAANLSKDLNVNITEVYKWFYHKRRMERAHKGKVILSCIIPA